MHVFFSFFYSFFFFFSCSSLFFLFNCENGSLGWILFCLNCFCDIFCFPKTVLAPTRVCDPSNGFSPLLSLLFLLLRHPRCSCSTCALPLILNHNKVVMFCKKQQKSYLKQIFGKNKKRAKWLCMGLRTKLLFPIIFIFDIFEFIVYLLFIYLGWAQIRADHFVLVLCIVACVEFCRAAGMNVCFFFFNFLFI